MKTLVVIPVYNEREKVKFVFDKFKSLNLNVDVMIVDDGSDDGLEDLVNVYDFLKYIRHRERQGIGSAIRDGINYALENNYDCVVVMAGNGKDDPVEIPGLLEKIKEGYDYVQGSRFLKGGKFENLPLFRYFAIRLFSIIWSIVLRHNITDVTNGFRAYRTYIFKQGYFDINQRWLDKYELEYYIHYYAYKYFKCVEVPVSKIYRFKKKGYSKIRPFIDWWSIIKPLLYLGLKIKK